MEMSIAKAHRAAPLPKGWYHVLLDEVAKRGSGHTPSKSHPEYWNGEVKWISLADSDRLDRVFIESTAAMISEKGLANSSAVLHPAGTVVLSRDAGVGKSAITRYEMAVSQHFIAWHCGPELNNIFLYYSLQNRKREFERIAVGSTIKTIGLPYFKELTVLRPPREEQDRIATAMLDADALIDSLEQLLTKKRQIKQGAMQELLTGKRRLPGFDGEWDMMRLGEMAELMKGSGLSKGATTSAGRRRCILYGELFTTYGQVIHDVVSRTNACDGLESIAGDVLVPGSTTTDGIDLATASALLESGVALGGDINVVRPKRADSFDPCFLANYLTHVKKREIAERAQGTTIVHLYGRDLSDLWLRQPSLVEQGAIAKVLSDMDAEITAFEARLTKARTLKQAMAQALLTGRIRLVEPTA